MIKFNQLKVLLGFPPFSFFFPFLKLISLSLWCQKVHQFHQRGLKNREGAN